jgi:hypothetical protein
MSIYLSDIQERIERSLYETLRKSCVSAGYLPDIELYPNTSVGWNDYQEAIKQIKRNKGFAIEVFNHSSMHNYGEKKVPRFVIHTVKFLSGGVGGPPGYQLEKNELTGQFNKIEIPTLVHDMYVDIYLTSNSAAQDRVLHSIIAATFNIRKYIRFYDDLDPASLQRFLLLEINERNIPELTSGLIERAYTYQILDLYTWGCPVVGTSVPIREICVDIMVVDVFSAYSIPLEEFRIDDTICVEFICSTSYVVSGYVNCGYVQ